MTDEDARIDKRLFALTHDAILLCDGDGMIKEANPQAATLLGQHREALTQRSVFERFPENAQLRIQQALQEAHDQEYTRFQTQVMREDGELRRVEVSASPISEAGSTLVMFLMQDITKQDEIDQQIQQLSLFPEQNPYPVIRISQSYQLEYANQASQPLLAHMDVTVGDYLPSVWQEAIEQVCSNGRCRQAKPTFEWQIGEGFCLFTLSFIPQTGQIYLYGQDITELKTYQQELKAANEELSTFIYKTHHDLKHPLSNLNGLIQMGQLEVTDETAQQYLQMIGQSADKLENILQSLIKAQKLRDTRQQATVFSLQSMIEELRSHQTLWEGANQVQLYHSIAEEVNNLYADRDALYYALENLIGNAIQYRDADKPEQWVKVTAQLSDQGIQLQVTDNGIGIPETYEDRIFEMFCRATNQNAGSGLGLYITAKAIRKIGGRITVNSKEGSGTTFNIVIPEAASRYA
jgi:PAS domain S-box-containing protein